MGKAIDLIGQKYSRLTVQNRAPNVGAGAAWHCLCDCGKKTIVKSNNLRRGYTKSCGCLGKEVARQGHNHGLPRGKIIHGMSNTRLYSIWRSMRARSKRRVVSGEQCHVHEPWLDFVTFKDWAMSNGYTNTVYLCRKNDTGDYAPDNVRWGTNADNVQEAKSKLWSVTSPNGETSFISNMSQFARENGLTTSTMCAVASGKSRQHKGWTCTRL